MEDSSRVGMGMNNGLVLVANLGTDRRREYSAPDYAVNAASNFGSLAHANEICAKHVTFLRCKASFAIWMQFT